MISHDRILVLRHWKTQMARCRVSSLCCFLGCGARVPRLGDRGVCPATCSLNGSQRTCSPAIRLLNIAMPLCVAGQTRVVSWRPPRLSSAPHKHRKLSRDLVDAMGCARSRCRTERCPGHMHVSPNEAHVGVKAQCALVLCGRWRWQDGPAFELRLRTAFIVRVIVGELRRKGASANPEALEHRSTRTRAF